MGTGFDIAVGSDVQGIIPRAVKHLFCGINERRKEALNVGQPPPDFSIKAQFIEVWCCGIFCLKHTKCVSYNCLNILNLCF